MAASLKRNRALRFDSTDTVLELVAVKDDRLDAEIHSARLQELVDQMILLGRKKGRPRKENDDEQNAA